MPTVDIGNGKKLEFPEGTTPQQMERAIYDSNPEYARAMVEARKRQINEAISEAKKYRNIDTGLAMLDLGESLRWIGDVAGGFATDVMQLPERIARGVPVAQGTGEAFLKVPEQARTVAPRGTLQAGMAGAARTLPSLALSIAAARGGAPMPLSFGGIVGIEETTRALQEGASAGSAFATGTAAGIEAGAIPEVGAASKAMAAKTLNGITRQMGARLSVGAEKAIESAAVQAGITAFTTAMQTPELARMTPEERKQVITEQAIGNLAFLVLEAPQFKRNVPSEAWRQRFEAQTRNPPHRGSTLDTPEGAAVPDVPPTTAHTPESDAAIVARSGKRFYRIAERENPLLLVDDSDPATLTLRDTGTGEQFEAGRAAAQPLTALDAGKVLREKGKFDDFVTPPEKPDGFREGREALPEPLASIAAGPREKIIEQHADQVVPDGLTTEQYASVAREAAARSEEGGVQAPFWSEVQREAMGRIRMSDTGNPDAMPVLIPGQSSAGGTDATRFVSPDALPAVTGMPVKVQGINGAPHPLSAWGERRFIAIGGGGGAGRLNGSVTLANPYVLADPSTVKAKIGKSLLPSDAEGSIEHNRKVLSEMGDALAGEGYDAVIVNLPDGSNNGVLILDRSVKFRPDPIQDRATTIRPALFGVDAATPGTQAVTPPTETPLGIWRNDPRSMAVQGESALAQLVGDRTIDRATVDDIARMRPGTPAETAELNTALTILGIPGDRGGAGFGTRVKAAAELLESIDGGLTSLARMNALAARAGIEPQKTEAGWQRWMAQHRLTVAETIRQANTRLAVREAMDAGDVVRTDIAEYAGMTDELLAAGYSLRERGGRAVLESPSTAAKPAPPPPEAPATDPKLTPRSRTQAIEDELNQLDAESTVLGLYLEDLENAPKDWNKGTIEARLQEISDRAQKLQAEVDGIASEPTPKADLKSLLFGRSLPIEERARRTEALLDALRAIDKPTPQQEDLRGKLEQAVASHTPVAEVSLNEDGSFRVTYHTPPPQGVADAISVVGKNREKLKPAQREALERLETEDDSNPADLLLVASDPSLDPDTAHGLLNGVWDALILRKKGALEGLGQDQMVQVAETLTTAGRAYAAQARTTAPKGREGAEKLLGTIAQRLDGMLAVAKAAAKAQAAATDLPTFHVEQGRRMLEAMLGGKVRAEPAPKPKVQESASPREFDPAKAQRALIEQGMNPRLAAGVVRGDVAIRDALLSMLYDKEGRPLFGVTEVAPGHRRAFTSDTVPPVLSTGPDGIQVLNADTAEVSRYLVERAVGRLTPALQEAGVGGLIGTPKPQVREGFEASVAGGLPFTLYPARLEHQYFAPGLRAFLWRMKKLWQPTTIPEIKRALERSMADRPIRIGGFKFGKSIAGVFNTREWLVRINKADDVRTMAHETAHMYEQMHRLALGNGTQVSESQWEASMPPAVRAELRGLDYDQSKMRVHEGFAEFVRIWMSHPDAQKFAPHTAAWFEQTFIPPDAKGAMKGWRRDILRAREAIMRYTLQGSDKAMEAGIAWGGQAQQSLADALSLNRQITLWVNDLNILEQATKELIGKVPPGQRGMITADKNPADLALFITQKSHSRALAMIKEGMVDWTGRPTVGPGLQTIFARKGIVGREKEAIIYAVAKRVVELEGKGKHSGFALEHALNYIQKHRSAELDRFAKEIVEWNRGVLEYFRQAGGMTDKEFDKITAENEFYIPFLREFEALERQLGGGRGQGRRIADTPQTIFQLRGSGRRVLHPIESMITKAAEMVSVADKIRVGKAVYELASRAIGAGDIVSGNFVRELDPQAGLPGNRTIKVERKLADLKAQLEQLGVNFDDADMDGLVNLWTSVPKHSVAGWNVVSFVVNGERKFFEVHPELFRTLTGLDIPAKAGWILETAFGATKLQRLGITGVRAAFLPWNLGRDFQTALNQTKFDPFKMGELYWKWLGKRFVEKARGAVTGKEKPSEVSALFEASGGELAQYLGTDMNSLRQARRLAMENTQARRYFRIVTHPVDALRSFLAFSDSPARLAEFELTLRDMGWKPGQTPSDEMMVRAALNAADVTTNFSRAGRYGRRANQLIPYFNPAIQGFSKFTRTHTESLPAAMLKGFSFVTIPAMANWLANNDDPEWQQKPAWLKWGFYNIKFGDQWVHIPTPFEWWWAYGAVPMAILDAWWNGLDKDDPGSKDAMRKNIEEVIAQAAHQLTPLSITPAPIVQDIAAFTPIIEAGFNRDTWTNRPLEAESERDIAPSERRSPSTGPVPIALARGISDAATKVSQILSKGGKPVEVSPVKIQALVNGYTGGILLDFLDAALRLKDGTAFSGDRADWPIIGRWFTRPGTSRLMDEFYDELNWLEMKDKTFNRLEEKGASDERKAWYELSTEEVGKMKRFRRVNEQLKVLRRDYYSTPETEPEKRKSIRNEMLQLIADAFEFEKLD